MASFITQSTTTGLFPLPDGAKKALQAQKGRQKDDLIDGSEEPEIAETYDEARQTVVEWQETAGLDRTVEGQLRWDDMLAHPLAVHPAVATGGLRRYYDNNNFYREVTVTGPLSSSGDLAADLEEVDCLTVSSPLQAIVPGPVSLVDLASDEHYGSQEAFLEGVGSFLADEIASFPSVETLLILEPSLAAGRVGSLSGEAAGAIARVTEAASEAAIEDPIVHTYWGAPAPATYRELLGIEDLGIGFDLVTARDAVLELIDRFGAPAVTALGVVDGQNTRVESVEELEDLVGSVRTASEDIEAAYLTFNTEGFYLPTNRFREKLEVLGRMTAKAEVTR